MRDAPTLGITQVKASSRPKHKIDQRVHNFKNGQIHFLRSSTNMPMLLNRSIALVLALVLSVVTATPDNSTGTVNCTDPSKNRVIGFELLDGSNDPLTQTVVSTFSTNITIDLNNFKNCDLNVRAIIDTPVPANCDINNVRCVRTTLGGTVRRDFSKPFTVFLASGGTGLPVDQSPAPGKQVLQACPYTDPLCGGPRPRCFEVTVDVIPCNKPPTSAPVKPPTNAPVKPPTYAPVKPPTNAPVKPPTNAPVKPPTNAPVKPPTNAPVKPPTNAPVKPPTNAPVKPPTHAPVKPPTKPPVKPPTYAPVKPPVKPPTPVCPYPEEWVNGCCKNTCRNAYICPANSCRIAGRLCYDNFDDCQCNYGYYKSTTEAKCLKYWWCHW
jgi:hypothetical protein